MVLNQACCIGEVRTAGAAQMSSEREEYELIESVAADANVPAEALRRLLTLDDEFPNMNASGMKGRLLRRVSEILDDAAEQRG